MTRPVRIAAQLHPQHGTFRDIRTAALNSESFGYDIVYNWDHFFPLYGEADGPHFECWTMLAAWAEATEHIEIGALVTCNSYRNPQLLADMARTVDHISEGRLILGIGSGWFRRDYDEYGYDFGTAGGRLRHLAAALPQIEERLAHLNPPPQRALPILIAGGGEKVTLRLVAQHAHSWHAGFPSNPGALLPKVEALRAWCAQVGRDPAAIEWGFGIEPDDLKAMRYADEYLAMGFTQFTLGFNGPGWDVQRGSDWLGWRDQVNATR